MPGFSDWWWVQEDLILAMHMVNPQYQCLHMTEENRNESLLEALRKMDEDDRSQVFELIPVVSKERREKEKDRFSRWKNRKFRLLILLTLLYVIQHFCVVFIVDWGKQYEKIGAYIILFISGVIYGSFLARITNRRFEYVRK